MATMADVAKKAGVSRATVSIVINGQQEKRKIPAETCAKVMKAVEELQYHPNVSARRMHDNRKSSAFIALCIPEFYGMNYLERLLNGALDHIEEVNYSAEIIVRKYTESSFAGELEMMVQGKYNAAIIIGLKTDQQRLLEQAELSIPVVLVNRDSSKYSTISMNNVMLSEQALDLIMESGVKTIGTLCSGAETTGNLRERLFRLAAEGRGINIQPEHILRCENSIQGGFQAIDEFMKLDNRPEALFCDADYIALGFLSACHQHNIQVPQDVKILAVGLLDLNLTEYCIPSLTILNCPVEKLASSAVDYLISAFEGRTREPVHITFNTETIRRTSF